MAQIFLSHSSQNNAAAIALRDWIIKGGWDDRPFLDLDPERGIAAGERWERALHEEADRCEAVLFLVSHAWLRSEWCLKEFHLAQKLNKRLFGVLIEDLPYSDVPTALTTTWQLVNLASGADHELFRTVLPDLSKEEHVTFSRSGLARLKAGLDKAGLNPRFFVWPPEKEPDRSPYPGLRPLEAEDAGIFFGRDASMVVVLDRLRGLREAAPPRLLVILGASGAGKSSFLRAGLMPRLARDDANFLPLPIIRPETAVITGMTGLIHSIQGAFNACGHSFNRAEITNAINGGASRLLPLLNCLAENARTLEMSGRTQPAPPSLVVAIDQGEELFLAEGAKEAQDFLTLLKELTLASAPNLIALFTIRSDSYERLQTAKALEGVRQEIFALPSMPRGAYQTIIEGPALRLQDSKRPLKIEPALIQALLTDIETGGGKDALPLLAFTLERLYRDYGADGDLLEEEYDALGRIRGSIQAAVDAALKAADADPTIPKESSERLVLLRNAFIPALAGVDRETHEPRRRSARISEIPEKARGLVNCLVEARLLATDSPPGASETIIEPTHEALLRQWDALQGWLKEDSVALLMLEGIRQAARDWADHDTSSDWLGHSAGRLEDAEHLREREDFARFIGPIEQAYLQACRAQENERRNRDLEEARTLAAAQEKIAQRTRLGLIAMSIFLVVLSVALVWLNNALTEYERLADTRRLAEAKAQADRLWPVHLDIVQPLLDWQRAYTPLTSRLEAHKTALTDLRRRAAPYTPGDRARDFAQEIEQIRTTEVEASTLRARARARQIPDDDVLKVKLASLDESLASLKATVATQRSWNFGENKQYQFRHDALMQLVGDLEAFARPGTGTVASIARRLERSREIARDTIDAHREDWAQAIERIHANTLYHGLTLTPQIGLIPLGPDPHSTLEEFLHWETHAGPLPRRGPYERFAVSGDTGVVLALIPGGAFAMGAQSTDRRLPNFDPHARSGESPVHHVDLAPYFISKYEMTQGQWVRFTGANPSFYPPGFSRNGKQSPVTLAHPIEQVSWFDAEEVLSHLGLQLPTEAQWERAARAGGGTVYAGTSSDAELNRYANTGGTEALEVWPGLRPTVRDDWIVHSPVGTFEPNAFGLHDMTGNVFEWCQDHYTAYDFPVRAGDGLRESSERAHVDRSGSFADDAVMNRIATRNKIGGEYKDYFLGVRPARRLKGR